MSPGVQDMPSPIDVEVAQVTEDSLRDQAHRTAPDGAELAKSLGLQAEALVVADERGNVAAAIVELARERAVAAIVVGSRGLSGLRARLEGSTSSAVLKQPHVRSSWFTRIDTAPRTRMTLRMAAPSVELCSERASKTPWSAWKADESTCVRGRHRVRDHGEMAWLSAKERARAVRLIA